VHKRIDGDRARINDDDERLREVERTLLHTATHHDANTLSWRQTVPGIGKIRSLVWRYAIHEMDRFPTGQGFVSYCRLANCAKASAGKRAGPAGTKLGNGRLTWAFSDAAVLSRRAHPPAPKDPARLARQQDNGTALPVLAHKVARAVYDRRKRQVAFDTAQFFPHSWRGAGEPGASRDTPGMDLLDARATAASRASWTAQARRGRETLSPARCLDSRSRSERLRG
jgi:hypothetical protein